MLDIDEDQLDLFFDEIYQNLDVPKDTIRAADKEHEILAEWLKDDSEVKFKTNSSLYPQGSVLFGTSVKPVKDGDDFDYDLVYLRQIQKDSISKKELKEQVGEQLHRFVEHLKTINHPTIPTLKEGGRCWTLKYGNKFHMDILPALPDEDHTRYTINKSDGIILTDKALHEWCFSNPKGYNTWFKNQMRQELNEVKARLVRDSSMNIEEIPDNDAKTILQRAIQILKRHRDSTFQGDKENKPISIIITTLATKSYKKTGSLTKALKDIVSTMASHIETKDGEDWVTSPINPAENFANKWKENPTKKEAFYRWLELANEEFGSLETRGTVIQLSEGLKKTMGETVITGALKSYQEKKFKRDALKIAVSSVKTQTPPHTEVKS